MHTHSHGARDRRALQISAAVTLAYVGVALGVGLWAHSLSLVSEAGHNLTDFLALLLGWLGIVLQDKPANASKTYGYQRAGVMAAFLNVLTLLGLTVFIVAEAVLRLRSPVVVHSRPMLIVGAVGVVMNAGIAWALHRGSRDVNMRAAFLHMIGDAVSTGLVILGALAIAWTGRMAIDPILSLVIAGFIAWTSWDILRETVNILLEGSPRGVRPSEVALALGAITGVEGVHDMHIWSLGAHSHALSCHIRIADIPPSASDAILRRVQALLAEKYAIRHTTIQFEYALCPLSEGCAMGAEMPAHAHEPAH